MDHLEAVVAIKVCVEAAGTIHKCLELSHLKPGSRILYEEVGNKLLKKVKSLIDKL